MKLKTLICLSSCLSFNLATAEKEQQPTLSEASPFHLVPQTRSAVRFDVSMPLRMITPKPITARDKRGGSMIDPGPTGNENDAPFVEDQALQNRLGQMPGPVLQSQFFALGNEAGVSPPDPAGDVGPNHYVAMTNLFFSIFDKAGNELLGPLANNTVWDQFGGACEAENSGDPIVLYDQISDRWLLSQFTSAGPDYYNCIAISTTPDPTGTYYRWAIRNNGSGSDLFPDYPKYGVWSDGFYISTRDFGPSSYDGVGVYALERDDMISGNPNPAIIYFFVDRSTDPWQVGDGLLPADIDGSTMPPIDSPQYFVGTMDDNGPYGAANDALSIWEFDADFNNPGNSTFTRTALVNMTPYDTIFPCGGSRACIDQLGTTNKIDIQSYRQRPLHRLAYRNFGTHESLVTNQSVESSANIGGIRWWEIRDPNNNPTIHQEGTYGPGANDGISRWMGSIAQDAEGNMGLAYSASSAAINPAIRFTGRLASDPLGQMDRTEGSIYEGTGSATASQRWGDYTSTNIDPVDDCTFWHVNEYFDTNGNDWQIRVGSFKFNECGDPGIVLSSPSPSQAICAGDSISFDLDVTGIGQHNDVVTLSEDVGNPSIGTTAFSLNPIPALPGSSSLDITNTGGTSAGDYVLNVIATSPSVDDKNIDLMLSVYDAIPNSPTLTSPVDGAINQDTQPSLNWTGSDTIEYTVEIATDLAFNNIVFSGTTSGNTLAPSTDLDSSTTYYWRVKANNSCGDSSYSTVFSFTTLAAPGDCALDQSAVIQYEYDFEAGLGDWTADNLDGTANWGTSGANVNSGVLAAHAVDVPEVSDQVLMSPSITLPVNQFPLSMSYWNLVLIEDNAVTACYDSGILEISTDDGLNFEQVPNELLLTYPYSGPTTGGFGHPLPGGTLAWCGDPPQDPIVSVVDLNDYAGQDVRLRFRLSSDNVVGRDGWFVDDVKVQSCEQLPSYTVGGTVSGLTGDSVTLQNNSGDDLVINTDGSFTFVTPVTDGFDYSVSVLTQPNSPNQICTVTDGSGIISGQNVDDVSVDCVDSYTVGGNVTGLVGNSVTLQNMGGDDLILNSNGSFTFDTLLTSGEDYDVTVLTNPTSPSQTCSVSMASGTIQNQDIIDVAVNCITNTYTIGGDVTGLSGSVTLQNNSGDDLVINTDGPFTFATALDDGSAYDVSVLTQPTTPDQICSVTNESGTLAGANVEDVAVSCEFVCPEAPPVNDPDIIWFNGFECIRQVDE